MLTYICAHCGEFAKCYFGMYVDSGTTMRCPKCQGITVIDLDKPEDRARRYEYAAKWMRNGLMADREARQELALHGPQALAEYEAGG